MDGVKLDGNEIWEWLYGDLRGNVPDALTDDVLDRLAAHIREHFLAPLFVSGTDEPARYNAIVQQRLQSLETENAKLREATIAEVVRLINAHRPDASFDDSSAGYVERDALLKNLAAEIAALAKPPSGGSSR